MTTPPRTAVHERHGWVVANALEDPHRIVDRALDGQRHYRIWWNRDDALAAMRRHDQALEPRLASVSLRVLVIDGPTEPNSIPTEEDQT